MKLEFGLRLGRLVIVDRVVGRDRWGVLCDCGQKRTVSGANLRGGRTRSCGCMVGKTHGQSGTPEHQAWMAMLGRCRNPGIPNYALYGARGIRVCQEWQDSFEAFLAHVGPRPSPKHSIDRINNDGNYEPGNCRWATRKEQMHNIRRNRHVDFKGTTMVFVEACRVAGIKVNTAAARMARWGCSFAEAVAKPVAARRTA